MPTTLLKPRTPGEWLASSLVWVVLGGYSWVVTLWVAIPLASPMPWVVLAAGAALQGWLGWRLAAGGWPVLTRLSSGWLEVAGWIWLLLLLLGLLFAQALTLELVWASSGESLFDIH
jgi:hypothetical protein